MLTVITISGSAFLQSFRLTPALKTTVLCVDDQPDALLVRKALLERNGYEVLCALDAAEALRVFRANRIDVVVSDHLLPGTTGTEMAREMKLTNPSLPILLFSGLLDPPGKEHADKFIDKTEGPEKLLEEIAALINKGNAGAPSVIRKRGFSDRGDMDERAATMAHEIKNPLESILNLLYLVDAEPGLSEQGHHYLELAREEVGRISQMARSVLDEFRDGEGPEEMNVPQLLRSVIALYKSKFEGRGIVVSTRWCQGANIAVYPAQLRRLFSNLLLNAADATPKGGRLDIRVAETHERTGLQRSGLRVTFADTGCGIPQENLRKILDPFFSTKGAGGSGLGLSVAQEVIRKHAGSLRVRSSMRAARAGSIFAVFLPRA